MTSFEQTRRTRTLARIVGPYLLVMGAALLFRTPALSSVFPIFVRDDGLMLMAGVVALIAGLCLLAAHHHWSGPEAAVISLCGIVATLKGASLVLAPHLGADLTAQIIHMPVLLRAVGAVMGAAGLWLAVAGWTPARSPSLPV